MIQCPNCHKSLSDVAKFCGHCGSRLTVNASVSYPGIEKASVSDVSAFLSPSASGTLEIDSPVQNQSSVSGKTEIGFGLSDNSPVSNSVEQQAPSEIDINFEDDDEDNGGEFGFQTVASLPAVSNASTPSVTIGTKDEFADEHDLEQWIETSPKLTPVTKKEEISFEDDDSSGEFAGFQTVASMPSVDNAKPVEANSVKAEVSSAKAEVSALKDDASSESTNSDSDQANKTIASMPSLTPESQEPQSENSENSIEYGSKTEAMLPTIKASKTIIGTPSVIVDSSENELLVEHVERVEKIAKANVSESSLLDVVDNELRSALLADPEKPLDSEKEPEHSKNSGTDDNLSLDGDSESLMNLEAVRMLYSPSTNQAPQDYANEKSDICEIPDMDSLNESMEENKPQIKRIDSEQLAESIRRVEAAKTMEYKPDFETAKTIELPKSQEIPRPKTPSEIALEKFDAAVYGTKKASNEDENTSEGLDTEPDLGELNDDFFDQDTMPAPSNQKLTGVIVIAAILAIVALAAVIYIVTH